MPRLLSISLSLLSIIRLSAQAPTSNRLVMPITSGASITISLNNNHDFSSHNSTISSTQQKVTIPPAPESPVMNKIAELWHENTVKQRLQDHSSSFLSAYKWHLLGLGLAGIYGFLCYIIVSGNYYLADNQLWSSWHQELPLDQLLSIPQQQLSQELLREIQRRYTDSESIDNLVKPLGKFMNAIEHEEEQLKWYQNIYGWISYARLPKLVPLSKHRFSKIAERLQRLAYYKNTFQSWAADYQLKVAERATFRCAPHPFGDVDDIAQLLQVEISNQMVNYWLMCARRALPPGPNL